VPLHAGEPRYFEEHEIVRPDAPLAPHGLSLAGGCAETLGVQRAVDHRDALSRRKARRSGPVGHVSAHGDQPVRPARSHPLGGAIRKIRQAALVLVERQAVDRVDDTRNAAPPCRAAAEDAGLGGVRVDDVGVNVAEMLREVQIRLQVVPRVDRPHERRHEHGADGQAQGVLDQAAFGPLGRPGEERHFVAEARLLAARQEGVLLGAAEDEARDDMDDFHGC
jgi:hypothetical protein